MTLRVGRTGPSSFIVTERDNCVLVTGALSVAGMKGVTAMCHKNAIVSPQLASMLGANFAFGLAKDVDALIAAITPELERQALQRKMDNLSDAAACWLASGERGVSSNTMFTVLTGVDALGYWHKDVPSDPADMRRCLLLLDQCPEMKPELHRMAKVSKAWAGLVQYWDQITVTMLEEWGDIRSPKKGASAPRTYELIKLATGRK